MLRSMQDETPNPPKILRPNRLWRKKGRGKTKEEKGGNRMNSSWDTSISLSLGAIAVGVCLILAGIDKILILKEITLAVSVWCLMALIDTRRKSETTHKQRAI